MYLGCAAPSTDEFMGQVVRGAGGGGIWLLKTQSGEILNQHMPV